MVAETNSMDYTDSPQAAPIKIMTIINHSNQTGNHGACWLSMKTHWRHCQPVTPKWQISHLQRPWNFKHHFLSMGTLYVPEMVPLVWKPDMTLFPSWKHDDLYRSWDLQAFREKTPVDHVDLGWLWIIIPNKATLCYLEKFPGGITYVFMNTPQALCIWLQLESSN